MAADTPHHPSSFRDPSGFIFEKEGILFRQVNQSCKEHFDHFMDSGCYRHFSEKGMLVRHEQIDQNFSGENNFYSTLKPDRVPFLSWPYEWCFDMLKDAALLTLRIARESLDFGMILKDATPFNIQFVDGKPVFIDTLSFEKFSGSPWIAYRQYCENFLGPLLLMHYRKLPLQSLQLAWPDGIPLGVVKSLLPGKTRFSFHTWLHIHLHAKISVRKIEGKSQEASFSKQKLINLLTSLEMLTGRLRFPAAKTTWSDYYQEASQRNDYLSEKKNIIQKWVEQLPGIISAADLGANDGKFSLLLAEKGLPTLAADADAHCINNLYREIKKNGEKKILPLVIDLSNPTPAIGVNNEERSSFLDRVQVDLVLALALIHHLAIGKNIPFEKIVRLFRQCGSYLIIEFVPKEDEKVKEMLYRKKDIYTEYNESSFRFAFEKYFIIDKTEAIPGSCRTLYLMKRK